MDQTHTPLRKTSSQPQSPPTWIDRDLSWLEFNRRVLARGAGRAHAAARARQVSRDLHVEPRRVLHEAHRDAARATRRRRAGSCSAEIRDGCCRCCEQQADCFLGPARAGAVAITASICAVGRADARRSGRRPCDYFDAQVSPALTPLVIHPTHPFPFFSNLSLSLAFVLHDDRTGRDGRRAGQGAVRAPAVGAALGRRRRRRARVRPAARSHSRERAQALSRACG